MKNRRKKQEKYEKENFTLMKIVLIIFPRYERKNQQVSRYDTMKRQREAVKNTKRIKILKFHFVMRGKLNYF